MPDTAPVVTVATSGMPWCMAPNRMRNTAYLSLTPGAKATLAALTELRAVVGNLASCAGQCSIDRKTFNAAISQLKKGGFVSVKDDEGILTIAALDLPTPKAKVKQAPTKPQADPHLIPTKPQAGNKELAIGAGSSDCPLNENKTPNGESEIKTETIDPLTPADAEASPAVETKADVFLVVPNLAGEMWPCFVGRVWDWEQAFPTLDVRQQLLSAASWINDNPTRRKADYPRFFGNWLRKRLEDAQGGQMRFPAAVAAKPASKLTNQPGGLRDVVL